MGNPVTKSISSGPITTIWSAWSAAPSKKFNGRKSNGSRKRPAAIWGFKPSSTVTKYLAAALTAGKNRDNPCAHGQEKPPSTTSAKARRTTAAGYFQAQLAMDWDRRRNPGGGILCLVPSG